MSDENSISTRFQISFVLKFCIAIGLSSLSSLVLFLYAGEIDADYKKAILSLLNLQEILIPIIIVTVLIQTILLSFIVSYLTLFLSHKIAGPVHNLEKRSLKISKGDLTKGLCYFRKDDQGQKLAKAFSEITSELGGVICSVQKVTADFKKREREVSTLLDADVPPKEQLLVMLDDFSKDVGKVQNVLNKIKTSEA